MFFSEKLKTSKLVCSILSNKKSILIISVVVLTIIASLLSISASSVCYALTIGGENIAVAESRTEIMEAVDEAERQASEILGHELSITDNLKISTGRNSGEEATVNSENLTELILTNVDGISKKYALVVNGTPAAALESADELNAILTDILDRYTTENAVSVEFNEDIKIEYMFVSDELTSDKDEIIKILSPDFGFSSALTVLTKEISQIPEAVDYETEYIYDDTMYSDEEETECEGVCGLNYVEYIVERVNGNVISSTVGDTECASLPVNEIIRIGTIPGSRSDSRGEYIWPADGIVSSYFGYRSVAVGSSFHKGIDIANDRGTEIYAADGGTVIYADWSEGYGNFIKIEHDNGDVTCYGHLNEILVSEGDKVAQGDLIAYMGNSGISSGPHLHFEVRPGGGKQDNPLNYLP